MELAKEVWRKPRYSYKSVHSPHGVVVGPLGWVNSTEEVNLIANEPG